MVRRRLRVCLLNPAHTAIGSRMPREHLPPLGLLAIGGPLLDDGFEVRLVDADFGPPDPEATVAEVLAQPVDVVLVGHSGSSSAHPTVLELAERLKAARPDVLIVYGGVHPTYHWHEILTGTAAIDYIVRGEGERTALELMRRLEAGSDVRTLDGIVWRAESGPTSGRDAAMIDRLDDYRVGWELVDLGRYSYWGGMRAVVVQFSRGCPHRCSYCGQRGFWTRWRHRDPVRFAKELAWLHRQHGVRLINFADELPTASRKAWQAFLEALVAENVPLTLVGSTRADDIVRDADILHLYRRAGVIRFLLGIESYEESVLHAIRKGTSASVDRQAIALLRQHGIVSMATYVVGFEDETDRDHWRSLRHLLRYDPDQIQMLYVTPHRWTPIYGSLAHRKVIESDTRKWDYKHQVLESPRLPAWRVFCWVKFIEVVLQLRPRALVRLAFGGDADYRHAMRWYTRVGRRVWFHEVLEFLRSRPAPGRPPTLQAFAGQSLDDAEYALRRRDL